MKHSKTVSLSAKVAGYNINFGSLFGNAGFYVSFQYPRLPLTFYCRIRSLACQGPLVLEYEADPDEALVINQIEQESSNSGKKHQLAVIPMELLLSVSLFFKGRLASSSGRFKPSVRICLNAGAQGIEVSMDPGKSFIINSPEALALSGRICNPDPESPLGKAGPLSSIIIMRLEEEMAKAFTEWQRQQEEASAEVSSGNLN